MQKLKVTIKQLNKEQEKIVKPFYKIILTYDRRGLFYDRSLRKAKFQSLFQFHNNHEELELNRWITKDEVFSNKSSRHVRPSALSNQRSHLPCRATVKVPELSSLCTQLSPVVQPDREIF